MVGMRDVEEIAGLREPHARGAVGVEHARQRVRRDDFDRHPARDKLPVLREEADVQVAEFQYVGLGFGILERDQPGFLVGGLERRDVARAPATDGRPLHRRDEVLHDGAAVGVAVEIDAAIEQRRELAGVEVG